MGVPEQPAERMSMAEQHEYLRSRFSRRTVIRGGAVTLGAVVGGSFVPGATAQAAVPTPATAPATETLDGSLVAPFVSLKDGKQNETVAWSRVRCRNCSFLRVDVARAEGPLHHPEGPGHRRDR